MRDIEADRGAETKTETQGEGEGRYGEEQEGKEERERVGNTVEERNKWRGE